MTRAGISSTAPNTIIASPAMAWPIFSETSVRASSASLRNRFVSWFTRSVKICGIERVSYASAIVASWNGVPRSARLRGRALQESRERETCEYRAAEEGRRLAAGELGHAAQDVVDIAL